MQRNLLNQQAFREYVESEVTTALPISDEVPGRIILNPSTRSLELICQSESIPDLSLFPSFEGELRYDSSKSASFAHLTVRTPAQMFESYLFLMTIVFGIERGETLTQSFHNSLDSFSYLLEKNGVLSQEKQLGLFGELIFLDRLSAVRGTEAALASWQGPVAGEHDFTLDDCDIEVKTTGSESRIHKIGSIQQLSPKLDRKLYFLSIQATKTGSSSGNSLASLTLAMMPKFGDHVEAFKAKLNRAGWKQEHNHLYSALYALRDEPLLFAVDSEFPKITESGLQLSENLRPRIFNISYRVNLDGISGYQTIEEFLEAAQ